MWVWFVRFISGFAPTTGQRVGKILWVSGIALLVIFCFNFFQKPNQVYKGPVSQVYNDNPKAKYSFFGCSAGHIRGGLEWGW